jgi:hypothetical protein
LFPTGDAAMSIGPALMVVYVILGAIGPAGLKAQDVVVFLRPFLKASPIRWACEALCHIEFGGKRIIDAQALQHVIQVMTNSMSSQGGPIFLKLGQSLNHLKVLIPNFLLMIGQKIRSHLIGPVKLLPAKLAANQGEVLLERLGLQGTTFNGSTLALLKMLFTHLALSLVGLIFSRRFGG